MSELFKLIKEEFSEVNEEWQWTYLLVHPFTFKQKNIKKITITDHLWRKKGREWITRELVIDILNKELHGKKRMKPQKRYIKRDVFVREQVAYQGKTYHLTFWFENNSFDWLWVRNCYPVN